MIQAKLMHIDTLDTLELVGAVESSVYQLIFPLGFLFYLHSFNLFRWRELKRAVAEWRYAFKSAVEDRMNQEYMNLQLPLALITCHNQVQPSLILHIQEHFLMSPLKSNKHFYQMVTVIQDMALNELVTKLFSATDCLVSPSLF